MIRLPQPPPPPSSLSPCLHLVEDAVLLVAQRHQRRPQDELPAAHRGKAETRAGGGCEGEAGEGASPDANRLCRQQEACSRTKRPGKLCRASARGTLAGRSSSSQRSPDGRLHEELLEDGAHVARGAPILQARKRPASTTAQPWREGASLHDRRQPPCSRSSRSTGHRRRGASVWPPPLTRGAGWTAGACGSSAARAARARAHGSAPAAARWPPASSRCHG